MEPPKKRKYPEHGLEPVSGSCGLVGPVNVAKVEMEDGGYGDHQQHVETTSSSQLPAKRNRRSYSLEFKVAVLDSYYNDNETRLNQRKTALKYGVNRRQIQKWLAQEETLRGSVGAGYTQNHSLGQVPSLTSLTPVTPPPASSSMPPTVTSTCRVSPSDNRKQTQPTNLNNKYPRVNHPNHQPQPSSMTLVETRPETASGSEEADFVIDEDREYKPITDFTSEYDGDGDKPINLCKVNQIKVENQVVSSRDARDPHQLPEVGSSVTVTSPTRSHPDPVSSHILDTSVGSPARGVMVTMFRMGGTDQVWTKLQARVTNDDGRASNFLSWEDFRPGTYKMHFATGQYFKEKQTETFYPYAEVVFEIKDPESHYHIPLLLNPFGYSTYRGS